MKFILTWFRKLTGSAYTSWKYYKLAALSYAGAGGCSGNDSQESFVRHVAASRKHTAQAEKSAPFGPGAPCQQDVDVDDGCPVVSMPTEQ